MLGGRAILCLLILGVMLTGFLGVVPPAPLQCRSVGCPLNAGVFAAAGANFAQAAFALISLFLIAGLIALDVFLPAVSFRRFFFPFFARIRPGGASQRKFSIWHSLKETSPTAA